MQIDKRYPAVAGMFYPEDAVTLRRTIRAFLENAGSTNTDFFPKALIVPHAGYIYSGPIAASAYTMLNPAGITRVILLGPAHRVFVRGLAVPQKALIWKTPLGDIPLDRDALERLSACDQVVFSDVAHEAEHSLEVQLPFLQERLGPFSLVPIVVGDAKADAVAAVLDALWGGPETLIVISSDLSHYEPYEIALAKDSATAKAILDLDVCGLTPDCACGLRPITGLVQLARKKGLRVTQVDLRNSGDTAGSRGQVVGYGSFAFFEEPQ
jgi:MEMO1 family protein